MAAGVACVGQPGAAVPGCLPAGGSLALSPAPQKSCVVSHSRAGRQAAVRRSCQRAGALPASFKLPGVLPLNTFVFGTGPSHPTNRLPVPDFRGMASPGNRETAVGLLSAERTTMVARSPPPAGPRSPAVAVCLFHTLLAPAEPRVPQSPDVPGRRELSRLVASPS